MAGGTLGRSASSAIAGDSEITTWINAYQMAYRMQSRAPELMNFSGEPQSVLDLYGANPGDGEAAFANNCLLARRLAERGVRFIQVYHAPIGTITATSTPDQ